MAAVARVESGFNPFAIGVVGGRLDRQPTSKDEAVRTAKMLEDAGYNFSVGVTQVNRYNLPKYQLDYDKAFDPCDNLRVGALILKDCFDRARLRVAGEQEALRAAFSCYYSGNFSTGFKPDTSGQPSYVQKVLASAGSKATLPAAEIQVTPVASPTTTAIGLRPDTFRVTGERDATSKSDVYANPHPSTMVFQP